MIVPLQALQKVDHEVYAACPEKEAGEAIRTPIHDSEEDQTHSEEGDRNSTLNGTLDEVEAAHCDALAVPGRCAPEYVRLNESVVEIVLRYGKAHKPISAVSRRPQALAAAGMEDHLVNLLAVSADRESAGRRENSLRP